jgi:hypothetical protein
MKGWTCLHEAVANGRIELVNILVSKGVTVNVMDIVSVYTPRRMSIV